jgi:superfamily I DNA and RNA helicase
MIETSPPNVLVSTFHELALNLYRQQMGEPDFSSEGVFDRMAAHFIEHWADKTAWLDLLVIDESQDFKLEWVSALAGQVKSDGKIYVLGDSSQQIYKREPFDIAEAVQITCDDNFRSPSKVVDDINRFKLTAHRVQSRSGWPGEPPVYTVHADSKAESLRAIATCVQKFIDIGYSPGQIVLVSFSGVKSSQILKELKVAGLKLRKPTGTFDAAGNALWTEGELLVDSVYRIKGQSAPAVIFCEVDFDELNQHTKSKLFVGMTRAQIHLEVLLTEKAANLLASAV